MSAKTGIEWTDSTWNPIRGCTRVSEGCRNCYAERQAIRTSGPGIVEHQGEGDEAQIWRKSALDDSDIWHSDDGDVSDGPEYPKLDWVICGGESGPGARPMHPDWARSLRDQCQAAEVPFFFKQWGEWAPDKQWAPDAGDRRLVGGERARSKGIAVYLDGNYDTPDCCSGTYEGFDSEAGAVEVIWTGKKAAGAELDGREWKQFPEARI